MSAPPLELPLPDALRDIAMRIEDSGAPAYLVGRCVRGLLAGETPAEYEIQTPASLDRLRAAFPCAVTGTHDRRLHLASDAGPIDLLPLPAPSTLDHALRQRDFRIHAIAYRPRESEWIDPTDGRADLAAGRLRSVGEASEALARDPLRAIRAVALAASLGLSLAPPLEDALAKSTSAVAAAAGPQLRRELEALLLGPHPESALALLRRLGIEATLASGVRSDAAAVVARLPADLTLRWTAWLRGAPARDVMRRLRVPRDRSARIERWLHQHPVDDGSAASLAGRARKLVRGDADEREALLALRRAELDVAGEPDRPSFRRFLAALERQQESEAAARRRQSLAIDGADVMARLGCGPGAPVGRALRHLADRVAADPRANERATLLDLLDAWWAEASPDARRKS